MKTVATFFPVAIATLAAVVPAYLPAQIPDALHSFSADSYTNLDGSGPLTELILSGNTLYGAASGGANGSGTNNHGTVFSINTDGSGFSVLHTFTGLTSSGTVPPVDINTDGLDPEGTMVLCGGMLYGSAGSGGTNGSGTLFALSTDGSVFSVLHTFQTNNPTQIPDTNSEGVFPNSLILCGDALYGTAKEGGNGFGTIFSIKTNGTDFTVLHTFSGGDGEYPQSTLVISDGILYGTTPFGGAGAGTVFSIGTNGANFTVIRSLPLNGTTEAGAYLDGLLLSGDTLYGTTSVGGTNRTGSIFSLGTDGSAFTVLHNFNTNGIGANFDGVNPQGGLVLIGDTLYGTANEGGLNGNGTIFSINTNGSGFSTLYAFTGLHAATNLDGAHPRTGVVPGGAYFYGTAYFGGGNANGTIFGLAMTPTITNLNLAGPNAVLNGINGLDGHAYTVFTSTNITLPLAQWNPVSTNSLAGGGAFAITATNAVDSTAAQQFYILQAQ